MDYARHIAVFFVFLLCMVSCGHRQDGEQDNLSKKNMPSVRVERFDRAVAAYAGMDGQERDSVLELYSPAIELMGRVIGIADKDSVMQMLATADATLVFQPDVEARMPDLSGIERDLGELKGGMTSYMPDLEFPGHIYGAIIPYDQSVIVADTFVVVGLNHYLGPDYEGYKGFDDYRRRLKTAERVVYDVAEALVYTEFPYSETPESNVLSRLIYEGLAVCAVKNALGDVEADSVMGYDRSQMAWLRENESRMWQKLASENMLFSTDPTLAARLVAPAPATIVINQSAPGRAGRYIGYRIVESYFSSHPDLTAVVLLKNKFYNDPSALLESEYSGN